MPSTRTLFSWIGHRDLAGWRTHLPAPSQELINSLISPEARRQTTPGPVETLLGAEPFPAVHLLSNYPEELNAALLALLAASHPQARITIHPARVPDPTDYRAIFEVTHRALACLATAAESNLHILLSPGTPAMAAIWVLLGKSSHPATFWQTHQGRAWETEIPFDLTVDYLPQAMRQADRNLQAAAFATPQDVPGFQHIIGKSPALLEVVHRARKAAAREVSILILGESGTGKELFARAIHDASPRKAKPFVAINCAAIPRDLLESELFGHARGAFTGATADRAGAFEQAAGGTLFLDEIGECPPELQAKMLRALQPVGTGTPCTRMIRRVGGQHDIPVDVRVLAATHRSPLDPARAGSFREDLYYRLAVIILHLPPLRERRGDAGLIAQALLDRTNQQFRHQEPGYKDKSFSRETIQFVSRYPWPGNVRQLHNAVVQAAVMAEGLQIHPSDMQGVVGNPQPQSPLPDMPEEFDLQAFINEAERHFIHQALAKADGRKTQAAKLLGLASYQTLDAKMSRLKINPKKIP